MLRNLLIVLRYFLFWIIFFFIERLVFVLWFSDKVKVSGLSEIIKGFAVGLWMDSSMTGYICVLPLLSTLLTWFFPKLPFSAKALRVYSVTLIILFSIICVFNANIYREWGAKINFKALDIAFSSPNEAIASSASSPVLLSLVVLAGLIALAVWFSNRIIIYSRLQKVNILAKLLVSFLLIGLNFLAIRGGWQLSPMNESMAYYSPVPVLNHAAVNTEWALLRDVLNNKSQKNPYQYFKPEEAATIVAEIYRPVSGSSPGILTTNRPNVVFIILESFTADVVESLGGDKGVAPEIEKLSKQGILFSNIYASGDRTDKGTVALLNAFPSQAIRSIMKVNAKQQRLPALSQNFVTYGYNTSFYYGGESEFFNMKSYLLNHKYQKIIDKNNFEPAKMNSKWGAYDDEVYQRLLEDARISTQPFFATLLTLTNHEPFEVPGEPKFGGSTPENKFRSTAFYADSCLGAFIREAGKESWGKNTLFVIAADHGHRLPRNKSEIYHPNRFRIPLLFVGDVVKPDYRGKPVDKVGSQTDIARTIFNQLDMDAESFAWSRDLLNPNTPDFAFFNWDNGFGVASEDQCISFDNTGKAIVYKKHPSLPQDAEMLKKGKAMMQLIFQQYIDY